MNKIVYAALLASLASSTVMAHCYKVKKDTLHGRAYYVTGHCYEHKIECEQIGNGSCELMQDCERSKGCLGPLPEGFEN